MNVVNDLTLESTSSSASVFVETHDVSRIQVVNAQSELIEYIDNMIQAIRSNQSVQATAHTLANKGSWALLKGTVSGANVKDLSRMIRGLGDSLETTQAVVQVMLRIQTRKDYVLREFHTVLVEKIFNIQDDTKTLDDSQRTVALDIVSALRDQVEDQLRQSETVDRHELRVQEIGNTLVQLGSAEIELREQLNAINDRCASLKKSDEYIYSEIERLQIRIKDLSTRCHEFAGATSALSDQLEQRTKLIGILETRLTLIDLQIARSSAWPARLRSQSFGLVGILIGIVSLVVALPK
jgi:archaellum component FlaC